VQAPKPTAADSQRLMSAVNGHMNGRFNSDAFPGRPRILFIGLGENSHTYSWIDLLEGASFNVRLFSMPTGSPPDDWSVRTYVTSYHGPRVRSNSRTPLYPANSVRRFLKRQTSRAFGMPDVEALAGNWLARILRQWRPDVIHTLGIEQGGEFYLRVRRKFGLEGIGKWVLQTRGGSDLALTHLDPERRKQLVDILGSCDQLISDNEQNFRIARQLGVREEQLAPIAPVPGTGGIDVERLREKWHGTTSSRRIIVWPKAYDSAWGKMLPTFEALKLVWDRIQPCEIHMLSMNRESNMWFWSLPETIRRSCRPRERVSRSEVLEIMPKARVMLAPALIDGVPNSLYEAMASGAFPIVSPLETILPVVKNEENVLFARNLYPNEIATALARAMTDDSLADAVAERNLELVRRIANRDVIRPRVIEFYENLLR
jgi:glycosyltransferase involved in cell wall biosynthesis